MELLLAVGCLAAVWILVLWGSIYVSRSMVH